MNPLDPIECSFEKIRSQKKHPIYKKDVIDKVKCFKENDKSQVWGI